MQPDVLDDDLHRIDVSASSSYSAALTAFLAAPPIERLIRERGAPQAWSMARAGGDARPRKPLMFGWRDTHNTSRIVGARTASILAAGAHATVVLFDNSDGALQPDDGFWQRYARNGRCALDERHELLTGSSPDADACAATARQCRWCHQPVAALPLLQLAGLHNLAIPARASVGLAYERAR